MTRRRTTVWRFCLYAALAWAVQGWSYPTDGEPESGLKRLLGQGGPPLPVGARMRSSELGLRLLDTPHVEFDAVPQDPVLAAGLTEVLARRDPSYAMVVVDFSDSHAIRWAALRPDIRQNAGSVGKIVCMLALFNALADAFPVVEERAQILRNTRVNAGDWVVGDSHAVPRFNPETGLNQSAILTPRDTFSLSEWVDHAISISANGAGTVIWREAMLLAHFGESYPPTDAERSKFFQRPKSQLADIARAVIRAPLQAAGLNTDALMQGSFWTPNSKRYVPGGQSYATPRELVRYMVRMEQGRLVDAWSSLEMKKYLYITKRRYRYVYAPELSSFAAYFKSGSLYQCQAEADFRCGKYMGNVRNMMNSVATIESLPGAEADTHYTVALMSNVLRTNSAWDHSRIAAAIHQLVTTRKAVPLKERATETELREVGRSE